MMSSSNPRRRMRPWQIIAAILLFLLLAAVGVLFLWQGPVLPPSVSIQHPQSGLLAEINQVVPVDASATYDRGITRVELYADGALVGSQDSGLTGGSNPLIMAQPWMPLTAGRHLLMARAYDRSQNHYDSSILVVDVVDKLSDTATINTSAIQLGPGASLPSLSDISKASGASLDTLRSLNPGLANLPASAPLPGGVELSVPYTPDPNPGNVPTPPQPLPGTPASPQITQATATDCSTAQLAWDTVTGADGYTVYRLADGETAFTPVAHLGGSVSNYTDRLPRFGSYIYQVGADKGPLEALSSSASVSTAASCEPAAPAGTTNLTVSFLTLKTSQAFDGIYCYSSLDGSPFKRIPEYDFQVMAPEADGLTYNLQTQLAYYGQLILPAQPISDPLRLTLECWGRHGAESDPLGTIQSAHGSSEWDGRDLSENTGDILLHYRINQNRLTIRPLDIPLTPHLPGPDINLSTVFVPLDGSGNNPTLPPPTNVRDIRAFTSTLCNTLAMINVHPAYCQGSNRWRAGDGIAWDWSDPTGRITDSDLTGYHIKVIQLDMLNPHHPIITILSEYDIHSGRFKSIPAPGILNNIGCSTDVEILVQAEMGLSISDYSYPLIYTAPPCTQNDMITVSIPQIIVGDGSPESITDNDPCVLCTDRRLELFGSFLINVTGGSILDGPTGHNGPEFGGCPDHTQCVTGGLYSFSDPGHSIFIEGSSSFLAPGPGRTLSMVVDLYDYDYFTYLTGFLQGTLAHFSNDPAAYRWCHATLELPGRSAVDWERFDQTFHLRDHSPEGACDVQIRVQGGVH